MMTKSLFILGWVQFGSPGMLAWAAAATLPVLIHLWRRRTQRQENWAAMAFLQAAIQKNSRRLWAEKWLLLAVRVAILILLAIALADPRWMSSPGVASDKDSGNTHVVIVIDGSYSMGYVEEDKSLFEKAKVFARQLLAAGRDREAYSLVLMAHEPRTIVADPTFEHARIEQEIDDLASTHGGSNLSATLAEIEAVLRRTSEPGGGRATANARVVFLTDLQQATWSTVESSECRSQLARLRSMGTIELIELEKADEENLAVTRLSLDSTGGTLVVAGREVQILADIHNFGQRDRTQQSLQILVNDRRIADERIDYQAGSTATFTFRHRFETAGEYVVEARLAEDRLELDNHRRMVIQARDALRVLCISSRPDDTRYLALALQPRRESDRTVEVSEAAENRLVESELREVDCVVLSNVARLSTAEAAALRRFVSSGGGLVVFLGDQVHTESYNRLLAEDATAQVLPARLDDIASRGNYRLNPLDYRHPIVSPFRGFPQAGLLTAPIWKYIRLSPTAGAITAIAFDNGDPALIERRVGRGRCLLLATAASPESVDPSTDPPTPWTALPTWPSFPPLVHEMVRFAVSGRDQERNVIVGENLAGEVSVEAANTSVLIAEPNGTEERALVDFEGSAGRWNYGPVQTSGMYAVKSGSKATRYAVNVDTRESDLVRFDRRLLPAEFQPGAMASASGMNSRADERTMPVYRWLLVVVAGLLVGEPWLAWLFRRGRG